MIHASDEWRWQVGRNMTQADKAEVWRRYGEGASAAMIARELGFAAPSIAEFIRQCRGYPTQAAVRDAKDVVAGGPRGDLSRSGRGEVAAVHRQAAGAAHRRR